MRPIGGLQDQVAALARDLESDTTPQQALKRVVDTTVDLVANCQAASISLASRHGHIRTGAASDDAIARADELQSELGEGPCVDAVWEEPIVSVSDLRSEDRWPRWAPRALDELGFMSMTCVRLFTHEDRVGALNLFSHESAAFDQQALDDAITIAAHAAVAVVAAEKIEGLQAALDSRTVIGQATGIVMSYYGLSADQSFQVLRRLSNESNRRINDIAREMVEQHDRDRAEPFRRPRAPTV